MMKKVVGIVLAIAASTGIAFATDVQKFAKSVGKYAASPDANGKVAKEKGLCVCLENGGYFGAAGFMHQFEVPGLNGNVVQVECIVPGFDPATGTNVSAAACLPFTPLAK